MDTASAPSFAKAKAKDLPSPSEAPVIIAILPFNCFMALPGF
jgi:hypothetical protein